VTNKSSSAAQASAMLVRAVVVFVIVTVRSLITSSFISTSAALVSLSLPDPILNSTVLSVPSLELNLISLIPT
jgi:hypothetical protein